ncbi:ABC transporter permease subunit [Carnobacterium alterfunditum]|uniref:ABC transporter permease subunit n=1 Tax=Carnobacterium alterfunditum TaxID=28230 RepID=UPI003593CC6C
MFSKPVFKQSVQANWKLWAIVTVVASLILSTFMVTFDAEGFATIASAAEGTRFSNLLSTMTSLLGSLENFYKLIAVILGIVYVVFTANNLVVNEVDSGSMAYTLSTPIKRSSVIFTKSIYLIFSIVLMYSIVGTAGLGAAQFQYQNVTGYPITDDVRAAAEALNQDEGYVSERLYLILENDHAMKEAATARDMDTESYPLYLEGLINERSYQETADIITDERWDIYKDDEDMEDEDIEITAKELTDDPAMILSSNDALVAGAKVKGMSVNVFQQFVNDEITTLEKEIELPNKGEIVNEKDTEILLQLVIEASSKALNMESDQVAENISLIKNPVAIEAATEATDLTEQQIITMSNQAMIASARSVDEALDFDTEAYFWLSSGLLLLILALSSISFFASTLFNRTGLALAIGGGIPFAFFLIAMIQQLMDTAGILEYITITSLFDTEAILTGGDFGWGLVALGAITFVLYAASNVIFTKKDLPL